jgi:hypothetical protein
MRRREPPEAGDTSDPPWLRATSAGDDPPQSRTFCPAFVHLCRGLLHPGGQPGRWWGNPAQVLTGTARGAPGQSVSPVCLQEKARFLETAWVLAIGSVPSLCIGRCRSAGVPRIRISVFSSTSEEVLTFAPVGRPRNDGNRMVRPTAGDA